MKADKNKIFEVLAHLAPTPEVMDEYLVAAGQKQVALEGEQRLNLLLNQLEQGDYQTALRAHLELLQYCDPEVEKQHRMRLRKRIYDGSSPEKLRCELLSFYKAPCILEDEDMEILLKINGGVLGFMYINSPIATTIRSLLAERCEEKDFMDSLVLGVKSINSSMRSEGAAIALYDALKKPHCTQLILRLLPELSERQSFIQVFTWLLKEEKTNYPEILPMSNSLIANYCPVTYTLVSELVETNADGYVGELVAQLLATQSNPLVVIRLVSEQCQ